MSAGAYFPGLTPLYGEFSIARGITPAVGTLVCAPVDRPSLGVGTLRIDDGNGGGVNFPDCLPYVPFLRQAFPNTKRVPFKTQHRWDLTVLDHRWRWAFGAISGEYNKRLADGSVDSNVQKTAAQLANLCLDAMGETGYDTSAMPGGVYPYVNWQNTNPALALWELCERVACEITGGEFAQVRIYRRGVGSDLVPGPLHAPYRFPLASKPNKIIARGGPTVFQSKFKLTAIALETDGTQKTLNNATYNPTWSTQSPISFPSLSGVTQQVALFSVWKMYRASAMADGSLSVPGCSDPVSGIDQCFPLFNTQVASAKDVDGANWSLPAYVQGKWWPRGDNLADTDTDTIYTGGWQLLADRGVVDFDNPVWSFVASSGAIQEPTLFLVASHHVIKIDNSLVRLERSQTIGGNGGDFILQRPELFGAIRANWSGTSLSGTTSSLSQAQAEADQYLALFAASFSAAEMDDQEYPGIRSIQTDGKIAQVKYSGGVNRPFRTRASTYAEFDLYSPAKPELRRRNLVELGKEASV